MCECMCDKKKIGLWWRGHYILRVSKRIWSQMSVVQIATMFCHGCFFSKSSPSAYILVTKSKSKSWEGVWGGGRRRGVVEGSGVGSDGGIGNVHAAVGVGEPGLVEGDALYVDREERLLALVCEETSGEQNLYRL